LELFYYVARYEGITAATKAMPFGIQQPAVSGQLLQLEEVLGVKLFQRRPFVLTPPGRNLYRFIEPFFSQLETVVSRIAEDEGSSLRVAASPSILGDHLPVVLAAMRKAHPGLRLTLRETNRANLSELLLNQEADVAIAPRPNRRLAGIRFEELARAPLVLIVPENSSIQSFDQVHEDGVFTEPLILPVAEDLATRLFRDGMTEMGIGFQPSVEVQSIAVVPGYVLNGFGVGLTIANPGITDTNGLRHIALDGVPDLIIDACFAGTPKPLVSELIKEAQSYGRTIGLRTE